MFWSFWNFWNVWNVWNFLEFGGFLDVLCYFRNMRINVLFVNIPFLTWSLTLYAHPPEYMSGIIYRLDTTTKVNTPTQ